MNYGWLVAGALVFSTPVTAELPEGDLTGQWSTIRFLDEHGRDRGISDAGLALIRDIYKRASDELHDSYAREIVALCKRPQDLRNGGQEGLVRFFERLDKHQDDVQLQALERIYDNLSPEDRKALDALMEDDRKSISRSGGGATDAARSGELTVEQVLERTCKPEILEQLQRSKERNAPPK